MQGQHALLRSETRNSFLTDALYCLPLTPSNYQLQRLFTRATEPVIGLQGAP